MPQLSAAARHGTVCRDRVAPGDTAIDAQQPLKRKVSANRTALLKRRTGAALPHPGLTLAFDRAKKATQTLAARATSDGFAHNVRAMLRPGRSRWAQRLYIVIFEADTAAGKAFDVALLVAIMAGLVVVSLDSVAAIAASHGKLLARIEWVLSVLFGIEYVLRLLCLRNPLRYAFSFFGLVDLLSLLPTFVSLLLPGAKSLVVIRSFRLLRTFRVLKLARYVGESEVLWAAVRASSRKISIFIGAVLTLVIVFGTLMYLIEGSEPNTGFTSIPQSAYWAVVTMTTVGYGDIAPTTAVGKLLASLIMIMGYGIIAVPTGIVSVELSAATHHASGARRCTACGNGGARARAIHCEQCGARLPPLPGAAIGDAPR